MSSRLPLWNPLAPSTSWEQQIFILDAMDTHSNLNFTKKLLRIKLSVSLQNLRNTFIFKSRSTNKCNIPIAVCDRSFWNFLDNCACHVVRLSSQTLTKLDNKHKDVMFFNNGELFIKNIQYFIDNGMMVIEGRNKYHRVLLFMDQLYFCNKIRWFKLSIKLTQNGNEIYLTSFHQIDDCRVKPIIQQGVLIRKRNALSKHMLTQYCLQFAQRITSWFQNWTVKIIVLILMTLIAVIVTNFYNRNN